MYDLICAASWRIGASTFIAGSIIWMVATAGSFASKMTPSSLAYPLVTFGLALWIAPVLFYWVERKARFNYFLQWKMAKVRERRGNFVA